MWEELLRLARLRERGATEVDESGLFRMIEQMRTISETAQKTTKRTRRERQRRTQTGTTTTRPTPPVPEPPVVPTDLDVVARFGEIEQW